MTKKKMLLYEDIHKASITDLLDLSYKELEDLIRQAEDVCRDAETTGKWLSAIKLEKTRLKHLTAKKQRNPK